MKNWADLFNFLDDLVFDVEILEYSFNYHVHILKVLQFEDNQCLHSTNPFIFIDCQMTVFKGEEGESNVWSV